MQQRKQPILKKLAEAREAQASAMSRFIQARARVMQVEARLQSLHARLAIVPTIADQPLEPSPLLADTENSSGIYKPDATPAARVIIPRVNLPYASTRTANSFASGSPAADTQIAASRIPDTKPSQFAEQAANTLAASMLVPDDVPPLQIDEDEEETKKMPALRPVRSNLSARQKPDAEETLIGTLSTLPKSEQSAQTADSNEAQEIGATDSTAKLPIIHRKHEQTQEPL